MEGGHNTQVYDIMEIEERDRGFLTRGVDFTYEGNRDLRIT